jgi:hypothetical protein
MNKIIDAEDILEEAKGCVECVFMAARYLSREEAGPIHTVTNIASKKIDEAVALLNEYREASGAGPAGGEGSPG